jgi:hypothetical protein
MNSMYCVGGALTGDHVKTYIERNSDREIAEYIRQMQYILLIAPRQQGKTSAATALMRAATEEFLFAYIDITTLDQATEMGFYASFSMHLHDQLKKSVSKQINFTITNSSEFQTLFLSIAKQLSGQKRKLVVILDELGATNFPNSTAFFSILRAFYNTRDFQIELKSITFFLLGVFQPKDLIKEKEISPFNIAKRVHLEDFSLSQVRELVEMGPWKKEKVDELAERIHFWTNGQPYPVQYICFRLSETADSEEVDEIVDLFRKEDGNLFPPLLDKLDQDIELRNYLRGILKGRQIKFFPPENKLQAQLELLGLIKADSKGFCGIRNHIHRLSLESYFSGRSNPGVGNRAMPKDLLWKIFVNTPRDFGFFVMDLFGRSNVKPRSALILGYILILLTLSILLKIVPGDKLITAALDAWRFIYPIK